MSARGQAPLAVSVVSWAMDERPSLRRRRKEKRLMRVLPADAEVDVLACPEHLEDLPVFAGLSRQPLDLDGVADARLRCCDRVAYQFASSGVETIRSCDGLGGIRGHPPFAAGNYESALPCQSSS